MGKNAGIPVFDLAPMTLTLKEVILRNEYKAVILFYIYAGRLGDSIQIKL